MPRGTYIYDVQRMIHSRIQKYIDKVAAIKTFLTASVLFCSNGQGMFQFSEPKEERGTSYTVKIWPNLEPRLKFAVGKGSANISHK